MAEISMANVKYSQVELNRCAFLHDGAVVHGNEDGFVRAVGYRQGIELQVVQDRLGQTDAVVAPHFDAHHGVNVHSAKADE